MVVVGVAMEEVGARLWVHQHWEPHPTLAPPLPRGGVPLSLLLTRKGPSHPAKADSASEEHLACILKFPRSDLLWLCFRCPSLVTHSLEGLPYDDPLSPSSADAVGFLSPL